MPLYLTRDKALLKREMGTPDFNEDITRAADARDMDERDRWCDAQDSPEPKERRHEPQQPVR